MSEWEPVPQAQNIIRNAKSGIYYLRAKIFGKIIRRSLATKSLKTAKQKRDHLLPTLRANAAAHPTSTTLTTLTQALETAAREHTQKIGLKSSSQQYWKSIAHTLAKTLPLTTTPQRLTTTHLTDWWTAHTQHYHPTRANNSLAMLKTLTKTLHQQNITTTDLASHLKRIPITQKHRTLLTRPQLHTLIQNIRDQKKRHSTETANMIHFLAYSGLRISELRALTWSDIHPEHLEATTAKQRGTSDLRRRLPIIAPLQALITEMLKSHTTPPTGAIFHILTPRIALTNACQRLNYPHQRVHDLRHYFATLCIEQNTEIPTVAKWLGHKDNGILAIKIYGHLRDEHSLTQAKKIK